MANVANPAQDQQPDRLGGAKKLSLVDAVAQSVGFMGPVFSIAFLVPLLVGLNAEAYGRIRDGGWDALYPLLAEHRDALLADPISAFRAAMAGAPESDREIMADPAWQRAFAQGASEALRPGAEGWTDETTAIFTAWDIDPEDVAVHIVWWHGRHDANVPLQAAERVVARIPSVDLQVWDAAGHLESYHREEQLLAGLMSR